MAESEIEKRKNRFIVNLPTQLSSNFFFETLLQSVHGLIDGFVVKGLVVILKDKVNAYERFPSGTPLPS